MLGEPLQRFPAEVQSIEFGIGCFQPGDDADRMGIVVEAAGSRERGAQRILAGMAERRMAEVVSEAQRLGQVLVEAERPRHRPADLRHFQAVRQADPVVVAVRRDEHLSFMAEAAEGDRVDQAVPVALENIARAARARIAFRVKPAARIAGLAATPVGRLIPLRVAQSGRFGNW